MPRIADVLEGFVSCGMSVPEAPRWIVLPDDPPELRAWLRAKQAAEFGADTDLPPEPTSNATGPSRCWPDPGAGPGGTD